MSPTETALLEENSLLKEQNTDLHNTLQRAIDGYERQIRGLQHRVAELLRRQYGRSSERLDPNQLLMDGILLEADRAAGKPQEAPETVTMVKEHARRDRHGRRSSLPEHLERVEHILDIPEEKKVCGCGKALKHIGDDVTEKVECRPSALFVNQYRRPKYACPDCECDVCGVRQAAMPASPIDKCLLDNGLLAQIIVEKFEHHMPLYRQEEKFARQGVEISRQVMADCLEGCAKAAIPLVELIKAEIFRSRLVLNDDTTVEMRDGPEPGIKTARFWATVGGEGFRYTMYNFTLGRGADGPEEFFTGFKGTLLSDAYAGYNGLFRPKQEGTPSDIEQACCWAHVRRKFVEAQKSAPRAAMEILILIARLYAVEKTHKGSTAECRLAARQKESRPVIENKIRPWLEKTLAEHLPQSPIRKAIEYTLGIWKELQVYLTDGRVPIDNNLAENAIRPIALGRKNWLFVGSETGGHTAATLMTLTATCHKNRINTWEYLKDVLPRIQDHPAKRLHELLPDHWQAARSSTSK